MFPGYQTSENFGKGMVFASYLMKFTIIFNSRLLFASFNQDYLDSGRKYCFHLKAVLSIQKDIVSMQGNQCTRWILISINLNKKFYMNNEKKQCPPESTEW